MEIKAIKINQDGNEFYIARIKARDLINIATIKMRKSYGSQQHKNYLDQVDEKVSNEIEKGAIWYLKDTKDNNEIQRKQSKERMKEIGDYISDPNSLFPNAIIINLRKKEETDFSATRETSWLEFDEKNSLLRFDEHKVVATVIDGQHRLGGFNYTKNKDYYLDNYELVVSIMIDLDIAVQAEMFSTINGKQRPVSKSVLYDLSELSESEYTELVTSHLIVKWFNVDFNSPLKDKIKMLGDGYGTISQSAFIDALSPLFSLKTRYSKNTRQFPIFYREYINKSYSEIMQKLFDYFTLFEKYFKNEWNYITVRKDDVRYILNKTTGITGLLIAYPVIYKSLLEEGEYDSQKLEIYIKRLKENHFDFSSDKYPGGSSSNQNKLADNLLETLFSKNEISELKERLVHAYPKIR